ncbi:MAG TPA: ATP-binding protein [Myxococcota bacterium]|nr:ATP-binding protein [Myxococcota bacterium]
MKPAASRLPLDASAVRFRSDVRSLGIGSTSDVEARIAVGDERGERALALALGTQSAGYHAFACGVEGPGRLERMADEVRRLMLRDASYPDWVYVHNFSDPSRPRAIRLAAGQGVRLRADLRAFLDGLAEDLPKAFREESFDAEKLRLIEAFQKQQVEQQRALEELASRSGFAITVSPPGGLTLVPLVDGRPVKDEEEFRALGAQRIAELDEGRKKLAHELHGHLERHRDERHRLDEEIRAIERGFAAGIVRPRALAIAARHENAAVSAHLEELVEHLLDNLDAFRSREETNAPPWLPFLAAEAEPFAVYDVNVAVDNSRTQRPPVVVVDSPTYKNLFGTIDRVVDRFGRLSTDFRKIQAGALLRADGGSVVLQAEDALVEPFVWRILRRTLRSGRVEIEAYDPFVMWTTAAVRPEPIQVQTKVVLVGPRWLFEMLLQVDDEFRDLFKVLADFSPVVERTDASTRALCGRIAWLRESEGLLVFDPTALDALVELAVRESGDRRKIHLGSERVLDAAREAAALASAAGRSAITREEVRAAVRERVHRLDRIEERIREAIDRGLVLLDLDGERVGQVNGLSVSEIGGHAFGRPSRLTATVGLGQGGVLSVEREVELSEATHDKGVLILQGFLRDRFAHARPLSLVASLAFEQSYGAIAGDSASLAELCAILSRIGGFPLRQDLGVTGSVNQHGEVQAVGGLDEKIEGFFDCCRLRGLTGRQGVIMPAANVENLALREDVVEAIERREFQVLPVRTVEEALEALTGVAAGAPDERDTLLALVDAALAGFAQRLAEFGAARAAG